MVMGTASTINSRQTEGPTRHGNLGITRNIYTGATTLPVRFKANFIMHNAKVAQQKTAFKVAAG